MLRLINVVIHGIPNKKMKLKNGDIISIDIGASYKGYHGDSAMTFLVLMFLVNKENL